MSDAGMMRAKELAALIASANAAELAEFELRYADDPRKQVRTAIERAKRRLERENAEKARVQSMYDYMREVGGDGIVLGVDEVGRGAVAGPLTVAAVALPSEEPVWGINDSKQLTPARRESLAQQIEECALAVGIAHTPAQEIDRLGMAQALRMTMAQAIQNAGVEPDAVLIDGNAVHVHEREICIVKGDARVACIAAASIVAKVTRDALMVGYDDMYPGYHLRECKGYASAEHIEAIRAHGLTEIHRASFCGNFMETPRLF